MQIKRFGWLKDKPDERDFLYRIFKSMLPASLPSRVDLRNKCSAIEDQEALGSCHDVETEVLSDCGWRKFSDLDGSERLATVNPETAELIFEMPVQLVRFHYKGKMACANNQSINFCVTLDHNMLIRKWDQSKRTLDLEYKFVPVKDIGWYVGLMNRVIWHGEDANDIFMINGVQHKHISQRSNKPVPMDIWLRFLGIYLADGTILKRNQKNGRNSYKIQIAAKKERKKNFVRDILNRLELNYLELSDRFTFENRRIYETLSTFGLEGVKAAEKFVPSFVFRQSASMIREFLLGHFMGDGCEQCGLRSHYTGSKKLANDLQLLIFLSGSETRISVRLARNSTMADGRTIIGRLDEHRVSVCEHKNLSIERKKSIIFKDYDGEVFCAEMPTFHTLVTRRKGKILISGNCTANAGAGCIEFVDLKDPGFREVSRLFLYYVTRYLLGTVKEDSGAYLRTTAKASAKFGVCSEKDWPYIIRKFAEPPPDSCYEDALNHQVTNYFRLTSLYEMKSCLAEGYPFMFGFYVYPSCLTDKVANTGKIPFPSWWDKLRGIEGGHAICAVGYDDNMRIGNYKGALLIRNSWGTGWGEQGYGWLPYEYVKKNIASDFWTVRRIEQ